MPLLILLSTKTHGHITFAPTPQNLIQDIGSAEADGEADNFISIKPSPNEQQLTLEESQNIGTLVMPSLTA
jgi:hypothetical protein